MYRGDVEKFHGVYRRVESVASHIPSGIGSAFVMNTHSRVHGAAKMEREPFWMCVCIVCIVCIVCMYM